jgi:hypothetical protein
MPARLEPFPFSRQEYLLVIVDKIGHAISIYFGIIGGDTQPRNFFGADHPLFEPLRELRSEEIWPLHCIPHPQDSSGTQERS